MESGRDTETREGPALVADGLTLLYGKRRAVDDVSLTVDRGAIVCLLGASGSGKTSVLRLLAGLERPDAGRVVLNGAVMVDEHLFVEPEHRHVGMVFQDYALFPHLTVHDNVAFGLRNGLRGDAARTVCELLSDVRLADRAGCYPHMLSGGERQRVALARALAPRPRLLLMDEPFSGLDVQLRGQVREQTIALLRRCGTTTVIVTHDPSEALRVADRIAVLTEGRLAQFGTPTEIYKRPCSPEMARAFGATNVIHGTLETGLLRTAIGVFRAPDGLGPGPVTICFRPQHVGLSAAGPGTRAVVTAMTPIGDSVEVTVRAGDVHLVARVPEPSAVGIGDDPHVVIDASQMLVFPRQATGALPLAAA